MTDINTPRPAEFEIVDVQTHRGGRTQRKMENEASVNFWSKSDHARMYVDGVVKGTLYYDWRAHEIVCESNYREATVTAGDGLLEITVRYVRGDTDRMDAVVTVAVNADGARAFRGGTEIESETDTEIESDEPRQVVQSCALCDRKIHGEKEWKEDAWMHPRCARKVGLGALGEFNTGERDFARRHLG